jgi:hypothetical protein
MGDRLSIISMIEAIPKHKSPASEKSMLVYGVSKRGIFQPRRWSRHSINKVRKVFKLAQIVKHRAAARL